MVPPKPPSLNPASTSLSPVTVVYWGYWKKQDETIQIASTTEVSAAVGVTGTGSIGGVPTTASNLLNSAVSLLNASKPPTSQSGENVPSKSQGSSVYQVSPASNGKTITGNKASQATQPRTSSPQQAKFTEEEIISGVSVMAYSFKQTGWTDSNIISYFLTPSALGYRQFPGITTEIFVEAVAGTKIKRDIIGIDVSSLIGKV